MTDPSLIPPRGRALDPDEREALVRDLETIVGGSHLFKSLDDEGRRELMRTGYVLGFADGEVLMEQGEPGDAMYLVMTGTVRVETSGGGAETVELAVLGRGACIGEVSVLSGGPRTATVRALSDVSAVAFEAHRIQRVVDRHPKVRALLEAMIEGRARATVEKLIG